MATASALDEMSPTRRAILLHLRRNGEARAEALARALGVTAGAVRQHLQGLAAAGLVGFRDERGGRGRPRRVWRLAPAAEPLFPKTYASLATELLGYVEDEDPELLARAFERRRRGRVAEARHRLDGLAFGRRVAELARILDEQGYLADFEPLPDGSYRITEHNCAVLAVAQRHGHACTSELGFLREVMPDAEIRRISHIVSGASACTYELRPRPA